MGWTVIKEDFEGNEIEKLSDEFRLSNIDVLYNSNYQVIKYLDPYGDTTFNTLMLEDLISDLIELKNLKTESANQIDKIIKLATDSKNEVHTFIKFYGD